MSPRDLVDCFLKTLNIQRSADALRYRNVIAGFAGFELIQKPLARIWQDLALVAIQEMRTPNATTIAALNEDRIGEYWADYSGVTAEMLNESDPELDELLKNSVAHSRS